MNLSYGYQGRVSLSCMHFSRCFQEEVVLMPENFNISQDFIVSFGELHPSLPRFHVLVIHVQGMFFICLA